MNDSGVIFFNKRTGITSFDALRDIKRALGTGKVGHTGTLDKFASGLLIVLVGKALRLSQWFTHCDKKYIGKIRFGMETDTLDPEGKIIAESPVPSREEAEKAISKFTGEILQAPPVYSAIHINGKRASNLARSGETPEMKKRNITIHKLELLSWQPPFAEIFVHCSSGTYIRSLARDIALAAGSRGYLCELTRTQVAGFELGITNDKCGITNKELGMWNVELGIINKTIINKLGMPWVEVDAQEAQNIFHGKPLEPIIENKEFFGASFNIQHSTFNITSAAVFNGEELIAIIEKNDQNAMQNWKYACVLR